MNKAIIAILPVLRAPKSLQGIASRLFDYMAAGLPVVVSDLPFYKELVKLERLGLLARPERAESFVEGIERLLSDKKFAYTLGLRGQRAFSEKYSWESQVPSLLAFYEDIRFKNVQNKIPPTL